MPSRPTTRNIHAAVTEYQRATQTLQQIRQDLDASPTAQQAVFSPQPYPLFLADWSDGDPLVGRIVGWSTEPGAVPQPVVVFEDGGSTCLPLTVNMVLGMGGGGPMWIRDSAAEALDAANAYTPPAPRR
jgi:hypothetical protein